MTASARELLESARKGLAPGEHENWLVPLIAQGACTKLARSPLQAALLGRKSRPRGNNRIVERNPRWRESRARTRTHSRGTLQWHVSKAP